MIWFLSIAVGYVMMCLLAKLLIRLRHIDYAMYFQTGKSFHSRHEGLSMRVLSMEGAQVRLEVRLGPHSKGPILHSHAFFDETFEVVQGTLHIARGKENILLQERETITIPRNTPHRPFNPSHTVVVVRTSLPVAFAHALTRMYAHWDQNEANTRPPRILFLLAYYGSRFDSIAASEGPPRGALTMITFLLAPWSLLLRYGRE